ncbi:MAG: Tub family-domain-containing protein, partial [Olpidium bornovanus]
MRAAGSGWPTGAAAGQQQQHPAGPSPARPDSASTAVAVSGPGGKGSASSSKAASEEKLDGAERCAAPPHQNPPPVFDGAAAAAEAMKTEAASPGLESGSDLKASLVTLRGTLESGGGDESPAAAAQPPVAPDAFAGAGDRARPAAAAAGPAGPAAPLRPPSAARPSVLGDIFRRVPEGEVLLCKVFRKNSIILGKAHPTFYVYNETDNRFLLSARKRKKSKCANYLISTSADDLTKDSKNYVGKLRGNFQGTTFVLYDARAYKHGKADKGLREHAGLIYQRFAAEADGRGHSHESVAPRHAAPGRPRAGRCLRDSRGNDVAEFQRQRDSVQEQGPAVER